MYTLQIPKYLKIGKFVKFLSENQNLQQIMHLIRPRSSIKTIVHVRTRCSKNSHFSFFLSFFLCFPGLTQDYLHRSPWLEYKSTPFWIAHVCDTLVLSYQDSDLNVQIIKLCRVASCCQQYNLEFGFLPKQKSLITTWAA